MSNITGERAGQLDLQCEAGADFSLVATFTGNGAAIDFTSFTADMQVRAYPGGPAIITEFSTANGYLALGGPAGTVTWAVPNSVTAALVPGTYAYDLFLISAGGVRTKMLKGSFIVIPKVTA